MTSLIRLAFLLVMLAACGGALKYQLRGTPISPGSDATLTAKVDKERNLTQLELVASNLTPPDRVLEGGTSYLVFVRRSSDTPWSRLGALELSDEGRTARGQLTVSEVAFDLLVSAEKEVTVASPSGKTVFEQRIESD